MVYDGVIFERQQAFRRFCGLVVSAEKIGLFSRPCDGVNCASGSDLTTEEISAFKGLEVDQSGHAIADRLSPPEVGSAASQYD